MKSDTSKNTHIDRRGREEGGHVPWPGQPHPFWNPPVKGLAGMFSQWLLEGLGRAKTIPKDYLFSTGVIPVEPGATREKPEPLPTSTN